MAQPNDPYAQFDKVAADPYAQFDQPGIVEDVAKAVPSGLAKGAIAVAGTPGDLQSLAKLADDSGYNPVGWLFNKIGETSLGKFLKEESAKTANTPGISAGMAKSGDMMGGGTIELPTSQSIKKSVEDNVTGKLYDAKTAPGRAVQTAAEVGPALATGPVGGLRGLAIKSAGAGVGSELAGQGAAAFKDKLPESAQPWAEPVARAVGTIPGMMIPTAARKVVTPLPMSDEQFNTVQALRQSNPELVEASTAGQLTERPRLMAMEARSPLGRGAEAAQEEAFTRGAMRQAGIQGDFSNINQGRAIGDEIGNIRRGNNIDSANFAPLVRDAMNEARNLTRTAGRGRTPQMDEVLQQIRFGAMNNGQPVLSMPGGRYNYMRGELERLAQATNNPEERLAIGRVRDRMDEAFRAGLPADAAANLQNLENQYANYNVLANILPAPGKTTITPKEVKAAVGHSWGNKAANEGRGTLAPLADDASRVMTAHPTPPAGDKVPPVVDLAISALSGAAHGAGGHAAGGGLFGALAAGSEGGVLGHLLAPSLYHGAANIGSRAVSSGPVQSYLGNQAWRPGASTTVDMDQLVRLLMSPESRQVTAQ